MRASASNRFLPVLILLALPMTIGQAFGGETACEMSFELQRWSSVYKVAHGVGTISCDNGQKIEVRVRLKTEEPAFDETQSVEGRAVFSTVTSAEELLGSYKVVDETSSTVSMVKGEISLSITGVGEGSPIRDLAGRYLTISLRRSVDS